MDPTDTFYALYNGAATYTALVNGHFPFHTPTLIIANALSSIPYSIAEPILGTCSPQNVSSGLFYNLSAASTNSPAFLVNFTQYGLGDVLDRPLILIAKSVICNTCRFHPEYRCNYEQHQDDTAQLVAHFISGIFNSSSADLQFVKNASAHFQNTVNTYQLNGYNPANQAGFCTHD